MSLEKELLQKAVTKYNELVMEGSKVCLENIQNGVFSWQLTDTSLDGRGNINCCPSCFFTYHFCKCWLNNAN